MKTKTTYPTNLQHNWTLLLLSCLFSLQTFAQAPDWAWVDGFGGIDDDEGACISVDAFGNVYSTGWFNGTVDFDPGAGTFYLTSAGLEDIFISKLDNSGNFVWARAMGGLDYDGGISIAIDTAGSGDVYATGWFRGTVDFDPGAGTTFLNSAGARDIFITRFDTAGNFVWAKQMSGVSDEAGWSIAIDPSGSGDVYTTGYFNATVDFDPGAGVFNLTSSGVRDIFISKLDNAGNFAWAKAIGGTGDDFGNYIALDPTGSGNVYTAGSFSTVADFDPGVAASNMSSAGQRDIFISKLDGLGNFVWAKRMGGTSDDYSDFIATGASGDVYITGAFQGTADFDPDTGTFNLSSAGNPDIFITRLDSSGHLLWAKRIGGAGHDEGTSIAIDVSGNVYTTGVFMVTCDFDPGAGIFNITSVGAWDVLVSKLDSLGNFLWAKAAGGTDNDIGGTIALDPSNNVLVFGSFRSPSFFFGSDTLTNASIGTEDAFIAKLDNIITGTENVKNRNGISVFPNPTTGQLSITSNYFSGKTEIEIYNMIGERVYEQIIISPTTQINLINQPAGIYFVQMSNGDQVLNQKLIIQK